LRCVEYPAGTLVELEYGKGQIVFVRSGQVLVTMVDRAGRETLCMHRRTGALIGLEALHGSRLPYQIWALTDSELCTAELDEISVWLERNPHPSQVLLQLAVRALDQGRSERIALRGDATQRVARFLLSSMGADVPESTRQPRSLQPLALRKNVLARILDMRPETLSRVLRKLERLGAVVVDPQVLVVDPTKLRSLIDGE
jgi:CRP-like cAMP-binding protein